MTGLLNHLLLTLRLNLRNAMALAYGYVVPVFTLIAFAGIYSGETNPLGPRMGQLLTICILGGACFGLPTAIVSERERGVWRRYRLLPASLGSLVFSTMVARWLIVGSAAVVEVVLAHWGFHTPWPNHPVQLLVAFTFACLAFLGMGLVIAMLAETVPAVQALGQAVFLPMIMVGGVGVPLQRLPVWARDVARFLPGWYSVQAMQACFNPPDLLKGSEGLVPHNLYDVRWDLLALTVIGAAALVGGAKMFRWDMNQKFRRGERAWAGAALAAWVAVGLVAVNPFHLPAGRRPPVREAGPVSRPAKPAEPDGRPATGPATAPEPATRPAAGYESITDADIAGISFDELNEYPDQGDVTPLASSVDDLDDERKKSLDEFTNKLDDWEPGKVKDPVQRVRTLLSVAATADILQNPLESSIPFVLFQTLKVEFPREQLEKILAWIILHPDDGTVVTDVSDLGIQGGATEQEVRGRTAIYAKKLLARLVGKVLEKQAAGAGYPALAGSGRVRPRP